MTHICPAAISWTLDNFMRRWFHKPKKFLKPYVNKNTTVLDFGCASGTFTFEIAKIAGKVIAADLQQDMLDKLKRKIKNIENIEIHKCESNKISLKEKVDFVLAFYVLHELPDQKAFFEEIKSILKPNGKIMIVEPKYHVYKKDYLQLIDTAKSVGFKPIKEPKIFLSRAIVMEL